MFDEIDDDGNGVVTRDELTDFIFKLLNHKNDVDIESTDNEKISIHPKYSLKKASQSIQMDHI